MSVVTIPGMIGRVGRSVCVNMINKSFGMACDPSRFCYDWEEVTTL